MRGWLFIFVLLFSATACAHEIKVTPLTAADVPALLKAPVHGERIIMLWALDCVYCVPNMQALDKLQQAHPAKIKLLTVATDSISLHDQIAKHLQVAGMQAYPARAYAEATPQRINFLIDPGWGGEMPRTLVIRADGSRLGISGELTAAQLRRITP